MEIGTIDTVVETLVAYKCGCNLTRSVSQNVNQYEYINVYRHSRIFSWMSFLYRNQEFPSLIFSLVLVSTE